MTSCHDIIRIQPADAKKLRGVTIIFTGGKFMNGNNMENPSGNTFSGENYQAAANGVKTYESGANEVIEVNMPFLNNLIGWATFKAVIEIIVGALSCLGIISAAYGIPQIIAGVKLFKAVDEIKSYMAAGEYKKLGDALYSFNNYFKYSGISIIVKIIFIIIGIIFYAVLIAWLIRNTGDFFNNFPFDFYY